MADFNLSGFNRGPFNIPDGSVEDIRHATSSHRQWAQWKYYLDFRVDVPVAEESTGTLTLPWYPGMRTDFRDVRFTTLDGERIAHDIKTSTELVSARVSITIPAGAEWIRCYYCNGQAVDVQGEIEEEEEGEEETPRDLVIPENKTVEEDWSAPTWGSGAWMTYGHINVTTADGKTTISTFIPPSAIYLDTPLSPGIVVTTKLTAVGSDNTTILCLSHLHSGSYSTDAPHISVEVQSDRVIYLTSLGTGQSTYTTIYEPAVAGTEYAIKWQDNRVDFYKDGILAAVSDDVNIPHETLWLCYPLHGGYSSTELDETLIYPIPEARELESGYEEYWEFDSSDELDDFFTTTGVGSEDVTDNALTVTASGAIGFYRHCDTVRRFLPGVTLVGYVMLDTNYYISSNNKFGFTDKTDAVSDGIYICPYGTTTTRCVTVSGGTATTTTVYGSHTSYNTWEIKWTSMAVEFWRNGVLKATHTTNIPTGALYASLASYRTATYHPISAGYIGIKPNSSGKRTLLAGTAGGVYRLDCSPERTGTTTHYGTPEPGEELSYTLLSPHGRPYSSAWPTGEITLHIHYAIAQTILYSGKYFKIRAVRCSDDGTPIEYSAWSARQYIPHGFVVTYREHTFTLSGVSWTAGSVTDRFAIEFVLGYDSHGGGATSGVNWQWYDFTTVVPWNPDHTYQTVYLRADVDSDLAGEEGYEGYTKTISNRPASVVSHIGDFIDYGETKTVYFITDNNHIDDSDWPTGPLYLNLACSVSGGYRSFTTFKARVSRINAAGEAIEHSDWSDAVEVQSSGYNHIFAIPSTDWTTGSDTDRVRVEVSVTNWGTNKYYYISTGLAQYAELLGCGWLTTLLPWYGGESGSSDPVVLSDLTLTNKQPNLLCPATTLLPAVTSSGLVSKSWTGKYAIQAEKSWTGKYDVRIAVGFTGKYTIQRYTASATAHHVYAQWKHRMEYEVASPVAEDMQTLVTVTLEPGMRSDFRDIRFASEHNEVMPYRISSTEATHAHVWVFVPQGIKRFYCYYGNGQAVSESNDDILYYDYDDLESGSVDTDRWDILHNYGDCGIIAEPYAGSYAIGSNQTARGGVGDAENNHFFLKLPDSSDAKYVVTMMACRYHWFPYTAWAGWFCGFGHGTLAGETYDMPHENNTPTWRQYRSRLQRTSSSVVHVNIEQAGVQVYDGNRSIASGTYIQYGIQTRCSDFDQSIRTRADNVEISNYYIVTSAVARKEPNPYSPVCRVIFGSAVDASLCRQSWIGKYSVQAETGFVGKYDIADERVPKSFTGKYDILIPAVSFIGKYSILDESVVTSGFRVSNYSRWKQRLEFKVNDPPTSDYVQASFTLSWEPGMRKDFRDIRFADIYGERIPYFIGSYTARTSAEVWLKVPANCQRIFCYYNNGAARSESDGEEVFELFDGFDESTELDTEKWIPPDEYSGVEIVISDGACSISVPAATWISELKSVDTFGPNTSLIVRGYVGRYGQGWGIGTSMEAMPYMGEGFLLQQSFYEYYVDALNRNDPNYTRVTMSSNMFDMATWESKWTPSWVKHYKDGINTGTNTNNIPDSEGAVWFYINGHPADPVIYIDWVAVRKCNTTDTTLTIQRKEPNLESSMRSVMMGAAIKGIVRLAGHIHGVSFASAMLGTIKNLTGDTIYTETLLEGPLTLDRPVAGEISATSTLAGTLVNVVYLSGSISATSELGGQIIELVDLEGSIDVTSSLGADMIQYRDLSGTIGATSDLSASLGGYWHLVGDISAESTLSGIPSNLVFVSGSISTSSDLDGATLVGGIKVLAGEISATSTLAGSITEFVDLVGNIGATSTVTGRVVRPVAALQGSIVAASELTGDLNHAVYLSGSINATSELDGFLSYIHLAGTISTTSSLSGSLDLAQPLEGTISTTSTFSNRRFRMFRDLFGSVDATTELEGSMDAGTGLAGDIPATSGLTGSAISDMALAGAVEAASSLSADMIKFVDLTGTIGATSAITGPIIEFVDLDGDIRATVTLEADLDTAQGLAGSIDATSDVSGTLIQFVPLAGTISATSSLSGRAIRLRDLSGNIFSSTVMTEGALSLYHFKDLSGAISATSDFTATGYHPILIYSGSIAATSALSGNLFIVKVYMMPLKAVLDDNGAIVEFHGSCQSVVTLIDSEEADYSEIEIDSDTESHSDLTERHDISVLNRRET